MLLELLVEIFAYSYDLWRPAGGCPGGAVRLWQARSAAAAPCPLWVGCQGLLQALEELAEALLDHSDAAVNSGRWLLSVAMKFGPGKCTGDKR